MTLASEQVVTRGSFLHTLSEQRLLRTHVCAAKHEAATDEVAAKLDRRLLDMVRTAGQPVDPTLQRVLRAAMYLLGQKETDVAVWTKCRKVRLCPHTCAGGSTRQQGSIRPWATLRPTAVARGRPTSMLCRRVHRCASSRCPLLRVEALCLTTLEAGHNGGMGLCAARR